MTNRTIAKRSSHQDSKLVVIGNNGILNLEQLEDGLAACLAEVAV